MFRLNRILEIVFFVILVTGLILFALMQRNNHLTSRNVFSQTLISPTLVIPTPTLLIPISIPISTPTSMPLQTLTMDSPDGTKKLTMVKQQVNGLMLYVFYTADKSDSNEKLIFKKADSLTQSLSIPYNTWSPDNVYFFLKEITPSEKNYYVFYVSGDLFSNNAQYLNIQELFTQKLPDFTLIDITGWAAPNLLLVNAKTKEVEKDISFWFDMTSQSFIQLSTYFN